MDKEQDRVRVLRIIEYVGDRDWVEATLEHSINGVKVIEDKGRRHKNLIKSAIIDIFPEILDREEGENNGNNGNRTEEG